MLSLIAILPAFVSATLTAFLCGILLKLGLVSFTIVFLAILLGDLLSNVFWYWVGRIGGNTSVSLFKKIFNIHEDTTREKIGSSLDIFNKYKDYATFFVSAPIGMAIMFISFMDAGLRKLSFWRYVSVNTLVSAIWVWIMLAIGYGFGYAYTAYVSILGRCVLSVALVVVLFILLTFGGWIRMLMLPKQ